MIDQHAIAATARALAREGFQHEFGKPRGVAQASDTWHALRSAGTSLWLDTGDLDEAAGLWNREFEALTTNNTLLNREVQKGQYDELIGKAAAALRAAAPEIGTEQLLLEIAFILNARHGLRLVDRFDAFVSVELHTALADDVTRTEAYGLRYYAVCPERFYVKVPLTPAGLLGAWKLGRAGVPVNLTLGFSARQNYLTALLAQPRFVNVFMGRLNAFVADNRLGDGRNVGEKATLATQRELTALRKAGRTKARLIGASMRDGNQVGTLAGLDVYTMPPKVVAQYLQNPQATVTPRLGDDPEVTPAPGVALTAFAAPTLWEVPPALKQCVAQLLARDSGRLEPAALVAHLEHAGFGDLFPRWSEEDHRVAAADGKIPVYSHWRDRLAAGQVGLDALMNLSAFHSFAADQKALDSRIAAVLQRG